MQNDNAKFKNILIAGNEALGLGALKAGLKFYAAYPMTPASSLLHFLASQEHEYKIIVKQTEDEIAAMNMVIGASIAGARAMCATSGGGFSLMVEALGFGAIIETPFVCMVGTRPGPATGMPTWTGQGDLRFVMHAAQDEFPRIILTPGDAVEAFQLGYRAFNLADKYQMPVIILSDKLLAESQFCASVDDFQVDSLPDRGKLVPRDFKSDTPNSTYKRYDPQIADGVSPRAIPGTEGHLFLANSDEHDEYGYSEEDSNVRVLMMDKRMRKLTAVIKNHDALLPRWYGPQKAKTTLICWGSTKLVCVELLKHESDVNILHFTHVYPLDVDALIPELKKISRAIVIEGNHQGIFADYLYEKTGFKADKKLVKYDGRPFFVEEVITKLKI